MIPKVRLINLCHRGIFHLGHPWGPTVNCNHRPRWGQWLEEEEEEGGRITYFKLVFCRFPVGPQGGEGGEKVEEVPGFHFHQVASLTVEFERDSSRKTDLAPGGAPGKRCMLPVPPLRGHMLPRFRGAFLRIQAMFNTSATPPYNFVKLVKSPMEA